MMQYHSLMQLNEPHTDAGSQRAVTSAQHAVGSSIGCRMPKPVVGQRFHNGLGKLQGVIAVQEFGQDVGYNVDICGSLIELVHGDGGGHYAATLSAGSNMLLSTKW